ncbi:MAG: hypothetical protein WAU86_01140 [Oricola sp.]
MTKNYFANDAIEIATFRAGLAAEARGLRRLVAVALIAATAFAGSALFAAGKPAAMQLNAAPADISYVLAYAEPLPERFGDVMDGVFAQEDDEHELNDAWMGMSVISKDGVMLGYISDASIDEDGMIDEIIVTPAGEDSPLFSSVALPLRYAELERDDVAISLTATQAVATLVPVETLDDLGDEELVFTEN